LLERWPWFVADPYPVAICLPPPRPPISRTPLQPDI
jgi:hypothetical protein